MPGAERRRHWFEITADLDATALEALRLELRRLAARHGLDVSALAVERLTSRRPESAPSRQRPSPASSNRGTRGRPGRRPGRRP